jgi:hypothetical protein
MSDTPAGGIDYREVFAFSGMCVLGALFWLLVYPVLDFVMVLLGQESSLLFLGAPYSEHSETASGFSRGLAEATRDLSGEHPFLASLPYWEKTKLLAYATFPSTPSRASCSCSSLSSAR